MPSSSTRTCTLLSKLAFSLACSVILFHAVVPHHHHDSGVGVGIVFENEIPCHCNDLDRDSSGGHRHSRHPLDFCKLQQVLSQTTAASVAEGRTSVLPDAVVNSSILPSCFDAQSRVPLSGVSLRPVRCYAALPPGEQRVSLLRAPPAC